MSLRKYSFAWVTSVFFAVTFVLHWVFGWFAYVNEQRDNVLAPSVHEYLIQASRDTFENWQSEFLQLIWQVAGLSVLMYAGSPQSKDSDERVEAELAEIRKKLDSLSSNRGANE